MHRSQQALVVGVLAVLSAPDVGAQSVEAFFFGGPGDQRASALTISNGSLYAAGVAGSQGVVVRYPLPLGPPLWSATTAPSSVVEGVAVSSTDVFGVGGAFPPTCGAADGSGGTEWKVALGRLTTAGAVLACQSSNFWVYRGTEGYYGSAAADEGANRFFYASGVGENCGSGHAPFILAKYAPDGTLVDRATEAGIPFDTFTCQGGSAAFGVVAADGAIYTAGYSQMTGQGEDAVPRPTVMRFDPALDRAWKVRDQTLGAGILRAVAVRGPALYAAGWVYTPGVPGSEQYLLQRYNLDGTLVWSRTWGGAQMDVLSGVAATPRAVYAVGHSYGPGLGGADAVIHEIDPLTGRIRHSLRWGGAQDDFARAVAVSGLQVFVAGESRSFAVGGNSVGQNDLVVMRYRRD